MKATSIMPSGRKDGEILSGIRGVDAEFVASRLMAFVFSDPSWSLVVVLRRGYDEIRGPYEQRVMVQREMEVPGLGDKI
jgi:hypothetical protein